MRLLLGASGGPKGAWRLVHVWHARVGVGPGVPNFPNATRNVEDLERGLPGASSRVLRESQVSSLEKA